jgi:hypothetical protein
MINLKSTSPKYNPYVPEKSLRPKCEHVGCSEPKVICAISKKTNRPLYNKLCRKHHNQKYYNGEPAMTSTARKLGLTPTQYVERAAMLRGFGSHWEYSKWLNSQHNQELPTIKDVVLAEIKSRTRVITSK